MCSGVPFGEGGGVVRPSVGGLGAVVLKAVRGVGPSHGQARGLGVEGVGHAGDPGAATARHRALRKVDAHHLQAWVRDARGNSAPDEDEHVLGKREISGGVVRVARSGPHRSPRATPVRKRSGIASMRASRAAQALKSRSAMWWQLLSSERAPAAQNLNGDVGVG